jgi:anti-sigma factor RsiW
MGRVVRFHGGRHREVQDLLPWYLGGGLDPAEHERVAAHLKVCAECQAEVRFQERLGGEISEMPLDVERGWARMRRRIAEDGVPRRAPWLPPKLAGGMALAWRTSPAWGGWATATVLVVASLAWLKPLSPDGAYHALSARGARPRGGDVLVVFRPETPEREFNAALKASGARIVGGPTEADAYVLSVPIDQRNAALATLRRRADVVMAEPIEPSGSP